MRNDYLDYLAHSGRSKLDGAKIGSGRYRLGSGKEPYQMFSAPTIKRMVNEGRLPKKAESALKSHTDTSGARHRIVKSESLEDQYRKAITTSKDLSKEDNDSWRPEKLSKEDETFWKEKQLHKLEEQHKEDLKTEYKDDLQYRNTILNNLKNIQKLEKELDPANIAKKEREDALRKAEETRNANVKSVNSLSSDIQSLIRQLKSGDNAGKQRVRATTVKGQKEFEKRLKKMSDEEIASALDRANRENKLREAMGYDTQVMRSGREKTTDILDTLGKVVGIAATIYSIKATADSMRARG